MLAHGPHRWLGEVLLRKAGVQLLVISEFTFEIGCHYVLSYELADYSQIVERALAEDIGSGDVTSENTVAPDLLAEGTFNAKQHLVLAGVDILRIIFPVLEVLQKDGDALEKGQPIARTRGLARSLLTRERVALNFLQRLSGIATLTRAYVDTVAGTNAKILDTRKTTPGLRMLEKMATRAGGAVNHRMGLWDAILIKNNHIDLAGGIKPAVSQALRSGLPVECEVRTHEEIVDALQLGVSRLLLDNMTPAQARQEVDFIKNASKNACGVEISGGVTLATVRDYAETGADFISIGALTHSATAVDINFSIRPLHQ